MNLLTKSRWLHEHVYGHQLLKAEVRNLQGLGALQVQVPENQQVITTNNPIAPSMEGKSKEKCKSNVITQEGCYNHSGDKT
ncbi:hypothetical protein PsorP6_000043 [Peronosclerospora sorghi]|uniref:Uncharacterized protein n=1 Tax=Peronosclerospora sorghi TaxID=230839 RepID=A0ACC0WSN0_9STRA|nr:hypothetical protein PsorP6_000043 [Peronosclerospora sorghi]